MAAENELTWEEWETLPAGEKLLVDLRAPAETAYGTAEGALCLPEEQLFSHLDRLSAGKRLAVYCARGDSSRDAARTLRAQGVPACWLQDGYEGWLRRKMERERDEDLSLKIELGLRREHKKPLFDPFARAVKTYDLIAEGDQIAVCISGGKDSMLMAKLFTELQRRHRHPFKLQFLVMDPGYSPLNRRLIEHNARLLGVPISVFESDVFDAAYAQEKNPCYLCARMRRGHLYSRAHEMGCNKIALGHHFDDVIETTLMGMLYSGQIQTMPPKLHSANFPGMELIRPMYLIREADILAWRDAYSLRFLQCACRFTEESARLDPSLSKRQEVKRLIAQLKQTNPAVDANLFRCMENVSLDTVLRYKYRGRTHSFLEDYDAARED